MYFNNSCVLLFLFHLIFLIIYKIHVGHHMFELGGLSLEFCLALFPTHIDGKVRESRRHIVRSVERLNASENVTAILLGGPGHDRVDEEAQD